VAQEGSVAAAARVLNVSHTTVMRRVRAFEDRLDEPIFEHRASGYRLSEKGQLFLDAAKAIETTLADLDLKIAGDDAELKGNVKITTTDSIFPVLVPDIAALRAAYPDVTLDVFVTNRHLDLFNRDADIAIRPSGNPPQDLVGRRTGRMHFGAYGAPALIEKYNSSSKKSDLPWLGMEEPLASSVPGQWLQENVGADAVLLRADSFVSLLDLAEAELGYAILPCHLGDPSTKLHRVFKRAVDPFVDLWVLTHRDVLRSRRVRACSNFLFEAVRARSHMFQGN
jgi:DNA-binding transcriptional LysR family regulator